jgi:hypothetical protein
MLNTEAEKVNSQVLHVNRLPPTGDVMPGMGVAAALIRLMQQPHTNSLHVNAMMTHAVAPRQCSQCSAMA